MIIIQLIGGLGNQMFQYALGRSLSIKLNIPFAIDISKFKDYKLWTYRLSSFNIVENTANWDQVNAITMGFIPFIKLKLTSLHILPYYKLNYIIEPFENYYTFDPSIFRIDKNVYLEGYWQSEKYFIDIENIIRNDFTLKRDLIQPNASILERIKKTDSVNIHIRRGDYVTNPVTNQVHGTCSLDYYHKAIDLIARNVDDPHFYIFSDDIQWVKENLKTDYPFYYVSNNKNEDYIDLTLMKNCKHHIIANSSFSWWGAWLSENPDKIVCAPSKWVNNRDITLDDLLPNKWVRL